jgi:hypothetical protein
MPDSPAGILAALLVLQGAMGAFDTLYNHEYRERLAVRPTARRELGLHAFREANYALLFGGLAWLEWHGAWAWVVGVLALAELLDTACDEYEENRTRVLPQNERVLHVFLTVNFGAILAALAWLLPGWAAGAAALVPTSHGWLSWALSAFALSSAAWSVRDFVAARSLAAASR